MATNERAVLDTTSPYKQIISWIPCWFTNLPEVRNAFIDLQIWTCEKTKKKKQRNDSMKGKNSIELWTIWTQYKYEMLYAYLRKWMNEWMKFISLKSYNWTCIYTITYFICKLYNTSYMRTVFHFNFGGASPKQVSLNINTMSA